MRAPPAGPSAPFLLVALGLPAVVSAQNFPPTAVAEVAPATARPGDPVQLTGSGSTDPDGGPQPLSYEWEFGDGDIATIADPVHAYAERGLFTASLRVFDGQAASLASVDVAVLEAPLATPSRSSASIAWVPGERLWVVGEDAGTVAVVDATTLELIEEIPVRGGPVSLALSDDGALVFVSCRGEGVVAVVDALARSLVTTVAVGRQPRGLVVLPSGEVVVALGGEGSLFLFDPADPPATGRRIALGGRPRAIAVTGDGSRAVVTDFLAEFVAGGGAGRAWIVDLVTETVDRAVSLGPDPSIDSSSSGRGLPNLLESVVIEPSGRLAHVGGLKSNVFRGLWRDGLPLRPTNRVRGVVAPIELAAGFEREDWRFDLNDADSGGALAFTDDGRWLLVAHHGLGELSVYDVLAPIQVDTFDGSAIPRVARIPIGDGLRGLVVRGDRAFVHAALARSVVAVDLSDPREPRVTGTVVTETEALPPAVLNGKLMFYRSGRPRHSSEGYVACGSCHPEGGQDGMVWDFTGGEGLRNTIDLRGRGGTAHGPVHWSANFDEIQDFENDIVDGFGGTGLAGDGLPPNPPLGAPNAGRGPDLDDLAAFVATFDTVEPSPFRELGGGLAPAALRGKSIFYSVETRCRGCHVPPRFTDSTLENNADRFRLHDVGTILPSSGSRLGGELTGLDTPTLKLLWDGAPYLHDGRASDLREVLVDWNPADRHGQTSQLSPAKLDDLVAFLLSVDDGADVLPDPPARPPDEVSPVGAVPLRLAKSGASLVVSWDLETEAETYVVSRGELGDFGRHLADAEAGSCDTAGEVQFFDADDLADGQAHFYLVAARNALGEGPVGAGRGARTPTPDCP